MFLSRLIKLIPDTREALNPQGFQVERLIKDTVEFSGGKKDFLPGAKVSRFIGGAALKLELIRGEFPRYVINIRPMKNGQCSLSAEEINKGRHRPWNIWNRQSKTACCSTPEALARALGVLPIFLEPASKKAKVLYRIARARRLGLLLRQRDNDQKFRI